MQDKQNTEEQEQPAEEVKPEVVDKGKFGEELDKMAAAARENPLGAWQYMTMLKDMAIRSKKYTKEIRQMMPIHENYKPCRKKCPLFKENKCYCKTCKEQMECWQKRQAEAGNAK